MSSISSLSSLPPSLPPSFPSTLSSSLCPLSLKMTCFAGLVRWHRAWRRLAQSCYSRLLSKEGWMLRHCPASLPALHLSCDTMWERRRWTFATEMMNCFPFTVISSQFPPSPPPPCVECNQNWVPPLGDKDIQSNVLPSRSPPDLTSRLLTLPDPKQHRLPLASGDLMEGP